VRTVWLCVRAGLRQDWRGLALLTLITALMGAVVLTALAGARRTDTAVAQFLQYAGPLQGQVSADPATFGKIAALPGVAYTETGALMLAVPVAIDGRPVTANAGEVITQAIVHRAPQSRAIVLAGRDAVQSRVNEVMLNESAAQALHAHVGSVLEMRGYRPSELQQVMNGAKLPLDVPLGSVVVTGVIRLPTDLTDNAAADADVTYAGQGDVIATAAFYQKYAASVGNFPGMSFQLKQGAAGLSAFVAQVRHLAGNDAQIELGDDNAAAGAFAQRGTTLEALALLVFAVIVALALLVVVGQSLARQTYAAAGDFPALRSLGATPRQLTAVALAPGALVAVAGMALAIPVASLLSWFTPIGLARRAEISPGFAFDAAALLGGAAVLALLLAGRAALAAPRAVRTGARAAAADRPRAGLAGRLASRGLSPAAVSGIQLAFEPGRGRSAVPVRAAIAGMAAALAAVLAALVFGSSVSHVIGDPAVAGWDWDVTVGNPHSGDISAQAVPRLRADTFVSGFTVTAMGDARLDGRDDVTLVGLQTVTGRVVPPVLAGRLPTTPGEIALGGRELRALGKSVGDTVLASGPHGQVPLRVTGEVVLSPEITNEQTQLGSGAVMTMQGAAAVSGSPMPRNVFLVSLRNPASPAAISSLKQQFPGTVLPAVPPPEVRDLSGVSGLPLTLAFVLMLLACGIIAHTLLTSVRRRRRDLAILKTVGFVASQVRATVAWQATALACAGLIVGVPLGLLAGRWAWILFASQVAIVPAPVISPLTLLAIPAVLLLANAIAAIPAWSAARTQPAVILRTE
jgi:FtsX-like permease family